jgi:O-antigen/teichoic acid export membrane protein
MTVFTLKQTLDCFTPAFVRGYRRRLDSSHVGSRLVRGAFWSLTGTVLARALGLLSSIIVARVLGKQGYGQLGIIQITIEMFGIVGGFGLGVTATKYVAELRRSDPHRSGRIIGLCSLVSWMTGAIMAVALALLAPWLAGKTLHAPQLMPLLRIGSLLLLFAAVNGAQVGVLSGFEAFKVRARITLFGGLINFPLMVAGVYFGGILGATWALVASSGANCVLNLLALRKEAHEHGIPLSYRGCFQERLLLWRFSIPAVLTGVVYSPIAWTANVLLVNQPHGYGEMGVYNAARQWQNLLLLLPNIFASVALPIFSSSLNSGKATDNYHKTFRISQTIAVLVAFPFCAALMFTSEWLLKLYGKGFAEGVPVVIGVLLGALIQCIGATCGPAIQAKGKMWIGLYYNLVWGILFLTGSALFVARFGASALSFSAAFAYLITALWAFWYLRQDLPQGVTANAYKAILMAFGLAGTALILPSNLRLLLALPVTLLSATVAVFFLVDPVLRQSVLKRKIIKGAPPVTS